MQPPLVILDTDFDTDCDDAGALAVLHALAHAGECEILGVICSVPVPTCVGAVRALNEACGRPHLPVGTVTVPDYLDAPYWSPYRNHRALHVDATTGRNQLYNEVIAASRPPEPPAEDAVVLYRRLLAAAPDASVHICGIGTLTALNQLLDSPPDQFSPLPGAQLIQSKVVELVSMAKADYPAGTEAFNWRMDPLSAHRVLKNWPTPITVSPSGTDVLTGAVFSTELPAGHPLRIAYETFLQGPGRNRPSWDQITVIYTVRGTTHGPFNLTKPFSIEVHPESAGYQWLPPLGAPRNYVLPTASPSALTDMVTNLMLSASRPT